MLKIRKAVKQDWHGIYKILSEIIKKGDTYAIEPDAGEQELKELWMAKPKACFVAMEKGEVAGSYYLKTNQQGADPMSAMQVISSIQIYGARASAAGCVLIPWKPHWKWDTKQCSIIWWYRPTRTPFIYGNRWALPLQAPCLKHSAIRKRVPLMPSSCTVYFNQPLPNLFQKALLP